MASSEFAMADFTLTEEEQRDDANFRLSPEIAINGID